MKINDYLNPSIVRNLLAYYGASKITEQGGFIRSTCPIHKGDNASAFVWDLKENLWFCHTACKIGGDLIRLHALINDLDERNEFLTIIEQICALIGVDKNTLDLDAEKNRQRRDREEWIKYVNKKTFQDINDREYSLNVLGTLQTVGSYKKIAAEVLKQNKVYYSREMNRLVFEIKNDKGTIVGVTCRRVNETDKIKWLHRPKGIDTGRLLYNLYYVLKENYTSVYIVEGVGDVLALKSLGINNVVCTFGAHMTIEQIELLSKYFIELILLYDNDNAGILANVKVIEDTCKKFDVYVKDIGQTSLNDAGEITSKEVFDSIPVLHYKKYLERVKGNENE